MHASRAQALKIAIVVFVAACAISIPVYRIGNATVMSRHVQLTGDVDALRSALRSYRDASGSYPTTDQGLRLLVGQRPLKRIPADPWKHEYVYRCPRIKHPQGYDLFSAGRNARPDTPDDDWGN
jgi:general secretion pathway protein G